MSIKQTLTVTCDLCQWIDRRFTDEQAFREAGWIIQMLTSYIGVRADICPSCANRINSIVTAKQAIKDRQ